MPPCVKSASSGQSRPPDILPARENCEGSLANSHQSKDKDYIMKIFKLFAAVVLISFALMLQAKAVVPPPDGGYPAFTTAVGSNALQNLTTGLGNTATGWHSLFANTAGNLNTGIGAGA